MTYPTGTLTQHLHVPESQVWEYTAIATCSIWCYVDYQKIWQTVDTKAVFSASTTAWVQGSTYIYPPPPTHPLKHPQAHCNKDLEWFKSVKETQGSVEVTSFGQMESILHCGHYTVGGKRNMAMHSIHDVVSLTLQPQGGKKLIKTSYNLNELRDLESKLVLITGSKAENRAAVEHFLNVRVHSISLLV